MNPSENLLLCPHAEICGVCSWIRVPYSEQKERKLNSLKQALDQIELKPQSEIQFHSVGAGALRDRVDLISENGHLGFFKKENREIFPLEECPLLSKPLEAYLRDVQKIRFPIRKGSLRLRVSPSGDRGAWLDFANEDIRDLLAEKGTVTKLMDLGFVEIGQRRKKLGSDYKLKDPELRQWTRTWIKGQAISLYSLVGSFSQSGDLANQKLIQVIESYLDNATNSKWIEFGAGTGNLTFPLAGTERVVKALEFDGLALKGLKKTLSENSQWENRISLFEGDYQRKNPMRFEKNESVLVNPPRSGLQNFLDPLFESPRNHRPQDFIYMSCFLESFQKDSHSLQKLGYQLEEISIVDQFPQSPHFEILSRWILSA